MSEVRFIACPFNCGYRNYGTGLGSYLLSNHFKAENLVIFDDWTPSFWTHTNQVNAALDFMLIFEKHFQVTDLCEKIVFLNGDHFSSFFTIKCLTEKFEDIAIVWIDPDLDLNTPYTSPSGNLHGMTVQHLLGNGYGQLTNNKPCVKPENLYFVASYNFDLEETFFLRELGIAPLIPSQVGKIKTHLPVYISIDFDVVCGLDAVNTKSYPSLLPDELVSVVKTIGSNNKISWIDFNEFNPYFDSDNSNLNLAIKIVEEIKECL